MKPAVLFTGGTGLLALNWAALIRDQYFVTLGMHKRKVLLDGVCGLNINLDSVDDISKAIKETRSSIIVHCAAITDVETCEVSPTLAYHVNTDIARNVAQACYLCNTKLVHISTDHVFSGTQSLMDESTPVSPVNIYAQTKAQAEKLVLDICPTAIVLRTNFFGWGLPYRASFSDIIIGSLRSNKEIGLFCDAYFTPIAINHLVHAAHEMLERGVSGIFHAAGDERLSKYDFGLRIAKFFCLNQALIKPILFKERRDLVPRPLDLSLNNGKMKITIGRSIGDVNHQLASFYAQESRRVIVETTL